MLSDNNVAVEAYWMVGETIVKETSVCGGEWRGEKVWHGGILGDGLFISLRSTRAAKTLVPNVCDWHGSMIVQLLVMIFGYKKRGVDGDYVQMSFAQAMHNKSCREK